MTRISCYLLLLLIASVSSTIAQKRTRATPTEIVTELLHHISAEKGAQRNWDQFRELFTPDAMIAILNHDPDFPPFETVDVETFIEIVQETYGGSGFEEVALNNFVDEFNGIAQVWQPFEGTEQDTNTKGRGITSYQLVHYEDRWWIFSLLWTTESDDKEIPRQYLEH